MRSPGNKWDRSESRPYLDYAPLNAAGEPNPFT
jgi:hypothetical protein